MAKITGDLSDTMTWSGSDYTVMISPITRRDRLELPGILQEADAQIVARTSLFSSGRPSVGQKVTVGSVEYRVMQVDTDEPDAGLVIYVENVDA